MDQVVIVSAFSFKALVTHENAPEVIVLLLPPILYKNPIALSKALLHVILVQMVYFCSLGRHLAYGAGEGREAAATEYIVASCP